MTKARELSELADTITVDGSGNLDVTGTVTSDGLAVDGNVGIGTSSPHSLLNVQGSGTTGGVLTLENSNTTISAGNEFGSIEFYSNDASGSAGGVRARIAAEAAATNAPTDITFSNTVGADTTVVERMRIDSSGELLLGTTAAPSGGSLHMVINSNNGFGAGGGIQLTAANNGGAVIDALSGGGQRFYTFTGAIGSESYSERMRIDSSGNVGIGTSSPQATLDLYNASGVQLQLHNSTTGTGGGDGSRIYLSGADLFLVNREAASMQFYTSDTQRMRIYSGGDVQIFEQDGSSNGVYWDASLGRFGIGSAYGSGSVPPRTFSVSSGTLNTVAVFESTDAGAEIELKDNGSGYSLFKNGDGVLTLFADPTDATNGSSIIFSVDASERMRINSAGDVIIGDTSIPNGTSSYGAGFAVSTLDRRILVFGTSSTVSGQTLVSFKNPNGEIGTIQIGATSTSYNTSSDYRLKENVTPLEGAADRLAQIPVHRFNFIADPDTTVDGFLAHEVQTIVPEAVTGEKDAVDADGNPEYQGIDQSKLVPLLTAALQEALQKIDALEAEVSQLKLQVS